MKLMDIILESIKLPKKGSPEELVELLKFLPVDETAKYISEEIYQELLNYNDNGTYPESRKFEYHPEDRCIQPYFAEIEFRASNNRPAIGFASTNYIEVRYLTREAHGFELTKGSLNALKNNIYHIVKHECSHFYLSQKNVEKCLYLTHPDGMKKYYHDRQELVLHSREIFERFQDDIKNWRTVPLNLIIKNLESRIKLLQDHTRINHPFPAPLKKKYLDFIVNNYIKPQLVNPS